MTSRKKITIGILFIVVLFLLSLFIYSGIKQGFGYSICSGLGGDNICNSCSCHCWRFPKKDSRSEEFCP